ncbi:Peroxidase [Bertholletia excelsa]
MMGLKSFCPAVHVQILVMLVIVMFTVVPCSSDLSFDFYAASCPSAQFIVKNTVRSATSTDPSLPGKLLRLLFHDCFVEGCDASVLLEGNGTERGDPANASLGGFGVIESAKRELEIFCPATVSCADVIALAARDAVEISGGPTVEIATGRRDGRVSAAASVRPNIIDTTFSLDQMMRVFSSKGLSLEDLVTLSGAHTIGRAHCRAFSERFRVGATGNLTFIDASLDKDYASRLAKQCGGSGGGTVSNDPGTPFLFDNRYYQELLAKRGLFHSDSALVSDRRTLDQVLDFAKNQASFFDSWTRSFSKLTSVGVKTGEQGEIRQTCSVANN